MEQNKKTEESHKRFKEEFGIHFKGAESELELVGGFLDDIVKEAYNEGRDEEAHNCHRHCEEAREKEKLQSAIDLLKNETNECDSYCAFCCQCKISRIVEDLESVRDIWFEE